MSAPFFLCRLLQKSKEVDAGYIIYYNNTCY